MKRHLAVLLVAAGLAVAPSATASAGLASSTTLSLPAVVASYGQPLTVAAQVSVPGATPDGWVYVVVDGVSRRTDLAADGTVSTTVEGLPTGTHQVWATFVPRDPAQQDGSTSAPATVEVQQAVSSSRIAVAGRRTDRPTRVRVRLLTPYGTEPTGKVRFVLRRASATVRRKAVLLEDGVARLTAGRLAAGRYRLVVRYAGDVNTTPLRDTEEFRVRRRP